MITLDSIMDAKTGERLGFWDTKITNDHTGELQHVRYFEATVTSQIRFMGGKWQRRIIDSSIEIGPGIRDGWVDHNRITREDHEQIETKTERPVEEKASDRHRDRQISRSGQNDAPQKAGLLHGASGISSWLARFRADRNHIARP